jgi:hypothetical protein
MAALRFCFCVFRNVPFSHNAKKNAINFQRTRNEYAMGTGLGNKKGGLKSQSLKGHLTSEDDG